MALLTTMVRRALPDASGPPVLSTCVHFMVMACALSAWKPPHVPGLLASELK